MDFHFGRKLFVLGFVIALVAGMVTAAGAVTILGNPEIRLVYNQEKAGHPGYEWPLLSGRPMISIGDSVEVRVTVVPPESVSYVVVDMCKYGGSTAESLFHFTGQDAWISGFAWVPSCSDGGGTATMTEPTLYGLRNPNILDETWQIWWDPSDSTWIVNGNLSGTLTAHAAGGSLYYAINAVDDTLFTFTISGASGVCCTSLFDVCDHFEFETHAPVQADSTFIKRFAVTDGGDCWIDHSPCWYEGHWDPRVQVIACDAAAVCDTALSLWPGLIYTVEVPTGDSLFVDTHWTKYAQLEDPAGYAAEFLESNDYTFEFDTDNAGNFFVFGLEDMILNPVSPGIIGESPDLVCATVDMRKLAHENGNDDIDSLYFSLSGLGDLYTDTLYSPSTLNDEGFRFLPNPHYWDITCVPAFNGWDADSILNICWPIYPGQIDVPAESLYITMWWISDSGDSTFFPIPTHKLIAIDNIIPATQVDAEPDTVNTADLSFLVDMTLAGDPLVLNPISEGNPTADWAQLLIDLQGLYDLDDVENGGQLWGDMHGIGFYSYTGTAPAPFGLATYLPMTPPPVLAPVYQTDQTDVIASPPSPYGWDQDSIITDGVWVFDDAGNGLFVGPGTDTFAIDNILPLLSEQECLDGPYIWAELKTDVAFAPGYANVGSPLDMLCNGLYNDRDEIVLHADLGAALGVGEVDTVRYVTEPYDPFCVGGITLFDNGTLGSDPVADDENWTGHARLEVAHTTRHDTTFCAVDTGEDSIGFEVLVVDDAGNAAINSSCRGVKVDNEPQTMTQDHVSIFFWDDPGTIGVDGDKNGDGIVNTGDQLIFEWRIEDETWDDMEIRDGSVLVDLSTIDPAWTDTLMLVRLPSGGIFRNYYVGSGREPFTVPSGSVDGGPVQAMFTNMDDAGNTPGWCMFTSDLTLDDVGPSFECDSVAIGVSGADPIASIGDMITFTYNGPMDDIARIGIWVGGITSLMDTLFLTQGEAGWAGSVVVTEGTLDSDALFLDAWVWDDVGNSAYYKGCVGPITIDNDPPLLACENTWLRLWDYNHNVESPTRIVNIGDNLTAIFYDEDGDIVRATADFSNYYDTETIYEMVPGFMWGPATKWGYRVDPVPDGQIDQAAGAQGTKVKITVWDSAGNMASNWFCPMWYNESVNDDSLHALSGLCGACLPVDTERPNPVPPTAITFELLDDNSNEIANVGDRLRIIVNMGDPSMPGYDMEWMSSFVQADIGQYGDDYFCADLDTCDHLFLTDDAYSAGGEGDGRFSYFFWFNEDDGPTLFEGAPIVPGETDLPAGDPGTKIRVRAMDDAGNWSLDWTESDVLVLENTTTPVAVDNYIPVVDPKNIVATFVDADGNGIVDIGDTVTVTVDMTDAPGGPIEAVYADLYDWGYPTEGLVPLTPGSPIYSITFPVGRNPGDVCADQPDGPVGFESRPEDYCVRSVIEPGVAQVDVVAKDISDNWSDYEAAHAPQGNPIFAALGGIPGPIFEPMISQWPFVFELIPGFQLGLIVDTDDPDPVNPTFPYPSIPASGVQGVELQDGRIGLQLFYRTVPRNLDVDRFFVYGDISDPGTIDYSAFLGEPIPAGMVPTGVNLGGNFEWVSDVLPEREAAYHFAVLAVDDANNTSDPALTWTTGQVADTTAPTATVQAVFAEDQSPCTEPGIVTTIGGSNVNLIAYLDPASEYINVVYVELYARVKSLGGEWVFLGDHGEFPSNHTVEGPYVFSAGLIGGHFDVTKCETFEIVAIPWDEAGNHITPDAAQKFEFTYDPFDPIVTMFAIDGNPSPYDLEVANSAVIEVAATDECALTGELTYWLYLESMGGVPFVDDPLLTRQTLPIGQNFTYDWDLVNYPAGYSQVRLYVCDQAGNYTDHFKRVVVKDLSAPTGVFADERRLTGSHPFYTRLLDGQAITGDEFTSTWFWVEWPDPIPFSAYDVGSVKMEWQISGSLEWTTIGIKTAYDDTLSFESSEWAGYEFVWDTRMFEDGAQLTLRTTVMDNVGNETVTSVHVVVAAQAPFLALTIPEAQDVCSENRIKGAFNIIATELPETDPIDTYYVSYIIKSHSSPDLGDCNLMDDEGWMWFADTLMLDNGTTSETIWRGVVNPAAVPLADGAYDIALVTTDVAGNWSWDMNDDWCVDAGYFAYAVANGMGMTVVLQNSAPEVRLRTLNNFGSIDEPFPFPQPVYVQMTEQVTVTSWTSSTCDVAKVEYFLAGDAIIGGDRLVGMSTEPDTYEATFGEGEGGIGQYLVEGALQHGFVVVQLTAKLTDVLGNESFFSAPVWILDVLPTSAFITSPAHGSCVGHEVALEASAVADDEIYSVTYQYRHVGFLEWTTIATTRPHDGPPWNTDVNGNTIYWNTDLLEDGEYELRAVAKDANLMDDPEPPIITVNVDNQLPTLTDFNAEPSYNNFIGGPYVELSVTAEDACGMDEVSFYYKTQETAFDDATWLADDAQAPFAFMWDGTSFTGLKSGFYDLIAKAEDKAGNVITLTKHVYIDQWAPDGWITQITQAGMDTDMTPDGSSFFGVITIGGRAEDNVPMSEVVNQKMDSGVAGAQFQYRPDVVDGLLGSDRMDSWIDLGGVINGNDASLFEINWDTGALVPGSYELRLVGIDNVGNRADVDGEPVLASVTINIVDQMAPRAVVAGVDVSGKTWAVVDTHDQDDIDFVRFEYRVANALDHTPYEWTVIGEVDTTECAGLYGVRWHVGTLADGNYHVRAVAYDVGGLFDTDPARMEIVVANGMVVEMFPTIQITSLDRWGNLDDFDEVEAIVTTDPTAPAAPTAIVVFDDEPENPFNSPWAKLLYLEHPDNQSIWVDGFSLDPLDEFGIATIIASYNDQGEVGAVTSTVKVFRVTDREGTKGQVSQDGMRVTIPPGANVFPNDGLAILKIQPPVADPDFDEVTPVGRTVQFQYIDWETNYNGADTYYEFANGLKASVTLPYDPELIPEDVSEANLRVAFWCGGDIEWDVWGISDVVVDQVNNLVSFKTTHTGAYAVVAASTLRITNPIFSPSCNGFTGRFPVVCSTIEDRMFGINENSIQVILDGPAGNKMFDNFVIWDDGEISEGFDGGYDEVSSTGCVFLDQDWDWEGWWAMRGTGAFKGLPGGVYTVTIKAMNNVGDAKVVVTTFNVDATKPVVEFTGAFVCANPSFHLVVTDLESGVDPETIFLDVYAVKAGGYGTEQRQFLGTITPSAMTYNPETGVVIADGMAFGNTLSDGMSIDVVVYDGNLVSGGTCEGCREYSSDDGVADCAGNHANPVWKRFTIVTQPPVLTMISEPGAQLIEVRVEDLNCGIETETFVITVDGVELSSEDFTFVETSVHTGILKFEVTPGVHDITVTAYDCTGCNFATLEIKQGTVVVGVINVISYPNPFNPSKGECATISFELTKAANVTIRIFDFAGEEVALLTDQFYGIGQHTVTWCGQDDGGKTVGTGAYIGFVKIDDGQKVITKNIKIGVSGSND